MPVLSGGALRGVRPLGASTARRPPRPPPPPNPQADATVAERLIGGVLAAAVARRGGPLPDASATRAGDVVGFVGRRRARRASRTPHVLLAAAARPARAERGAAGVVARQELARSSP